MRRLTLLLEWAWASGGWGGILRTGLSGRLWWWSRGWSWRGVLRTFAFIHFLWTNECWVRSLFWDLLYETRPSDWLPCMNRAMVKNTSASLAHIFFAFCCWAEKSAQPSAQNRNTHTHKRTVEIHPIYFFFWKKNLGELYTKKNSKFYTIKRRLKD